MSSVEAKRRRLLVSGREVPPTPREFLLLPALLLVEALFLGAAFETYTATVLAMVPAGLLAALIQLSFGDAAGPEEHAPRDAGRPPDRRQATPGAEQSKASARWARGPLARWRGWAVWPLVALALVAGSALRIADHLSGNLNPVAMVVDTVSHVAFFVSLGLWSLYPRRGHPAMLGLGFLLVLTTVTAGGVSHSIHGQLIAALGTVIGFSFAADHILGYWQPVRAARQRARARRRRSRRSPPALAGQADLPASTVSVSADAGRTPWLYSILALSILLMSTSAAGHLAANVVPGLQLEFFDRLSESLEAVTSNSIIGSSRYVRGSRLGSVRRHMIGDPGDVALRAYADNAPGYLRGTVFDNYGGSAWSIVNPSGRGGRGRLKALRPRNAEIERPGQTPLKERTGAQLERFQLRKNASGKHVGTVEVHNVPLKGQLVFTSLSTDWMEAATYGVTLSHHDTVLSGVDTQAPYVLGIASEEPREPLAPIRENILLRVPPPLRRAVTPLARSICEDRLTARSKARAIEDYFQNNYTYSLRAAATPRNIDPVEHFLDRQHPAHCEFFASAAAILLRCVEVPTRYVTGYVVDERSDDGKYWIARNRDAHAWVEAYDEISQRWFPVEATVGRVYRSLSSEDDSPQDVAGSGVDFFNSQEDQTLVGRVLTWLGTLRATDSLAVLFRFAQLPLFCLVALLLWIRQRQKRRDRGDVEEFRSRQMLQRVDRRMKRYALVRGPSETLHQFARRIEATAGGDQEREPLLNQAAHWYRQFAVARYRGATPPAFLPTNETAPVTQR